MRIGINIAGIAACLAATACGGGAPDDAPVGRAMREADTSRVPSTMATKVDARTMRVRRMAGTWRGGAGGGDTVEAAFGNDGTLSVQVERDGGIVDAATGRWSLEDGLPKGTMEGGKGALSRYAKWRGAFANDTTVNVSGSGGAIMTLRR